METKKTFKVFTIFEHEKEQTYLRKMHKSGWKFIRVTGVGMYHFEKCVPEDVVYQLDYNQEGLTHKDEYVQMFNDCGWEYLQDYFGYSYFRKPASEANGTEEIFCDENSRTQMLERVFKGRLLPLFIIFFCILIPQLFMNIYRKSYLFATLFGAFIVLYVLIFSIATWKYLKYKNKHRL